MNTLRAVRILRELADEIEKAGPTLVLTPVAEVEVGDVVSITVGELIKITRVEVSEVHRNAKGLPMISLTGEVPDADEYEPRYDIVWPDEWIAVQR